MTLASPLAPATARLTSDVRAVAGALLERARELLAADPGAVASARRPLEGFGAERALALWDLPGDALCWIPAARSARDGERRVVGWGVSARVRASGDARFAEVQRQGEALLAGVRASANDPRPHLFGGFSFVPGAAAEAPWRPFGDALFVLPRWSVEEDERGAALRLSVRADELELAASEVEALASALMHPRRRHGARALVVQHEPRERWDALLSGILAGIEAGTFAKVVAARRAELRFGEGELALGDVLATLGAAYPGCTTFGLRLEGGTFFGATPERLVARRERELATEALAGSAAPGEEARLRASVKDLDEHRVVVEEIRRTLGGLGGAVSVAEAPVVERLPNVSHLQTPITARFDGAAPHVLAVAAALHPTPAVGGLPREAALSQIVAHEAHPRGWYSAPFGHFDAEGGGEFVVALRSGLVSGERAYAYAGGGIVAGSEPAAEYQESALKLAPVLAALGGEA